jgi:hypothetical protein
MTNRRLYRRPLLDHEVNMQHNPICNEHLSSSIRRAVGGHQRAAEAAARAMCRANVSYNELWYSDELEHTRASRIAGTPRSVLRLNKTLRLSTTFDEAADGHQRAATAATRAEGQRERIVIAKLHTTGGSISHGTTRLVDSSTSRWWSSTGC